MSDNGGGEYAAISGLAENFVARIAEEYVARGPGGIVEIQEPPMPVEIRREAWKFAIECYPDDSLCQNIQNADLIARWLHAGSVPQV